jgi:two-component system, sensor histidine kinase and response regulator
LAQEKGICLQMRCESPEDVVLCDRERILQVLANLLGNSLKFCRRDDRITVTATRTCDAVQVGVCDTGPGIASGDLPMVFDPYWSGASNQRNGSGLGLYITKNIIEAHHARIWIESELGAGTKVFFTLPQEDAVPQPHARVEAAAGTSH